MSHESQVHSPAPRGALHHRFPGEFGALGALVALAAALRFAGLGSQSLWLDEAFTWRVTDGPLSSVLGKVDATESTPPLYYWLNWFVVHTVGTSEASLRLLSTCAGTLTVIAVWAAARRLVSTSAGLIAAALVACSPFMWWYSQEARAYALAGLLCAIAFAGFSARVNGGGAGWLIIWSIASALAIATQYSALAVVAATSIILVIFDSGRIRQTVLAASAPAIACLLVLPVFLSQQLAERTDWIGDFPLQARLASVLVQPWSNSVFDGNNAVFDGRSDWLVPAAIASALVIVALIVFGRRAAPETRRGIAITGWVLLLANVFLLIALTAGGDHILPRYWIVVLPTAAVAAGGVIGSLRSHIVRLVVTAGTCAVMLSMIAATLGDPKLLKPDWRPLAAALGPAPSGGRIIVTQGHPFDLPLAYYASGSRIMDDGLRVSPAEVLVVTPDRGLLNSRKVQDPNTWWVGAYALTSRMEVGDFVVKRYGRATPTSRDRLTAAMVLFSLRRTISGGSIVYQPEASTGD